MNPLPTKTAKTVEIGGQSFWIKTLNDLERKQAGQNADIYAARQIRPYRPGKPEHEYLLEVYADAERAEVVAYIAEHRRVQGKWQQAAAERYPSPNMPERTDQTEEAFAAEIEDYEEKRDTVLQQQQEYVDELYSQAQVNLDALTEEELCQQWQLAWRATRYHDEFSSQFTLEILALAVRHAETKQPVFSSTQQVAELDDEFLTALIAAYFTLDSVSPAEIPTTPVVS